MTTKRNEQAGIALVLAMLALMLLTFLGITLAATTSTELQIAQNYRLSQMAQYHAEAGLEVGKRILRASTSLAWAAILPQARSALDTASGTVPSYDTNRNRPWPLAYPNRSLENNDCSGLKGVGYGVVLDPLNTPFPFQNVNYLVDPVAFGLNGTFTIWIRRPIVFDSGLGLRQDSPRNDELILTSEGTAPIGTAGEAAIQRGKAVRVMQAYISLIRSKGKECNQEGCTPEGSGADTSTYGPESGS